LLALAVVDLKRLLARRRFYLVTFGAATVSMVWMLSWYSGAGYGVPHNACHATVHSIAFPFLFTLPLLAGLVAADSLALDRSSGYMTTLWPRCRHRLSYVLGKAAAAAGVVGLAVTGVYLLVFLLAAVQYPILPPSRGDGRLSLFAVHIFWKSPVGYVILRWGLLWPGRACWRLSGSSLLI